jgi:hypothetical protein
MPNDPNLAEGVPPATPDNGLPTPTRPTPPLAPDLPLSPEDGRTHQDVTNGD